MTLNRGGRRIHQHLDAAVQCAGQTSRPENLRKKCSGHGEVIGIHEWIVGATPLYLCLPLSCPVHRPTKS